MQEPNEGAHLKFDRMHTLGPMQSPLLFAVYIGLSWTVGAWARRKGRSAANWYMLSLLVTPLLAAVALAFQPPREPREDDNRKIKMGIALLLTMALGAAICLFDLAP